MPRPAPTEDQTFTRKVIPLSLVVVVVVVVVAILIAKPYLNAYDSPLGRARRISGLAIPSSAKIIGAEVYDDNAPPFYASVKVSLQLTPIEYAALAAEADRKGFLPLPMKEEHIVTCHAQLAGTGWYRASPIRPSGAYQSVFLVSSTGILTVCAATG